MMYINVMPIWKNKIEENASIGSQLYPSFIKFVFAILINNWIPLQLFWKDISN